MNKSDYTEVSGGLDVERTWPAKGEQLKVGQQIEGTYLETKTGVGKKGSTVHILDVAGEKVGVWGNAVLNGRFDLIQPGSRVGIEYTGEKLGQKSGNYFHDFFVGVSKPTDSAVADLDEEPGEPNPL